LVEQLICNQ